MVTRWAHIPKIAGSSPALATIGNNYLATFARSRLTQTKWLIYLLYTYIRGSTSQSACWFSELPICEYR